LHKKSVYRLTAPSAGSRLIWYWVAPPGLAVAAGAFESHSGHCDGSTALVAVDVC